MERDRQPQQVTKPLPDSRPKTSFHDRIEARPIYPHASEDWALKAHTRFLDDETSNPTKVADLRQGYRHLSPHHGMCRTYKAPLRSRNVQQLGRRHERIPRCLPKTAAIPEGHWHLQPDLANSQREHNSRSCRVPSRVHQINQQ